MIRQLLALGILAAALLFAQGLRVTGKVKDETGKPIPQVTVKLITPTRGTRISATNSRGEFLFGDLGNGDYLLSFEKEGYVTLTKRVEVTYDHNNDDGDDDDGEQIVLQHAK